MMFANLLMLLVEFALIIILGGVSAIIAIIISIATIEGWKAPWGEVIETIYLATISGAKRFFLWRKRQ